VNPQQREAAALKALDLRSLTIVWALVLATPVAAMSQSSVIVSVCPEGSGPACQTSALSGSSTNVDAGGRAGFAVTDPATLVVLGAGLVSLGLWTRRILPGRRVTSSS